MGEQGGNWSPCAVQRLPQKLPMTLVRVVTGYSEVRFQVQGFRVMTSLATTQVLTPSRCWAELDGRVMGAPCRPLGKEW